MWVFDGEEWTEEGASEEKKRKVEPTTVPMEQFVPELQVVEVVPVVVPKTQIPFPLP